MRHLLLFLALIVSSLHAQTSGTARRIQYGPNLPGTCPGGGWVFIKTEAPNTGLYDCPSAGGAPRYVPATVSGFTAQGAYSGATAYAAGDYVSYNGVTYISVVGANTGNTPDSSPSFWATPGPAGANGSNGSNGTNGTNGATILSGSGAPGAGTGANGDYYFRTDTGAFYGPKAAGSWPGSGTSLVGPAGPAGPAGEVSSYPGSGIARSNGSAWQPSLGFDTDNTLAGNSDTVIPSQKAIKGYTDNKVAALKVFAGVGTYAQMTAANLATNDIWILTNAVTTSLCTSGGLSNTSFALCIKDANGVIQPIVDTRGGGGGSTGNTTVYGGFTGGGATVTISDADCVAADDTVTVQNKLDLVANGGTVDFQNTTNPCDIGANGIFLVNKTNVRVTSSVTAPTNGHLRAVADTTANREWTLLDLDNCDDCLFDKLKINANSKNSGGFFITNSSNFSIQNNELYGSNEGTGSGPYAAIKADEASTNFWIANNNIHDLHGTNGGDGVRCIWAGVGTTRYTTTAHILDNTCANPGHTGIAVEGLGPIVTGNLISSVITQGTCMKFIAQGGATADAIFDGNTCNRTYGAGFQTDPSTDKPTIYVRNNIFKLISDNTVNAGSTFGSLYVSGSTGGGGQHIRFTNNTLDTGRQVANMNNASDVLLQNNTIINGLGAEFDFVTLENTDHDITVINSGNVNMWNGCNPATAGDCFNIFEDGVQLAFNPAYDRNVIVAYNLFPVVGKNEGAF